jgi:RNA polymerase sigma-70 factor (ECF subfamily)
MNEQKAIRLCLKNRDPIGFEYLVQKYREKAFYHAIGWLNSREDALDACQESFTRAFGAIARLRKLKRFYPWFYVILRNCCMNILADRSKSRRINHGLSRNSEKADTETDGNALSGIESREESRYIHELLQVLKPEFKEILVLKYFNEMNYDEIVTLLGIPRGTVMSRLYHARRAFHDLYIKRNKEDKNA